MNIAAKLLKNEYIIRLLFKVLHKTTDLKVLYFKEPTINYLVENSVKNSI